ncbi:MAG: hypothetical protein R6U96_13260 [Promethearchaeia archaeon]
MILYSDVTYELKEYFRDYQTIKNFIYKEAEIIGKTRFPLDKAVKSIIREKRKIGQKLFRIIVISDGYIYPKMSNPIKFAKAANDLGIIIDFLRFGKGIISGNILKRVVEITGGNNYYIQDELEYESIIEKIAAKKKIKISNIFSDTKEDTLDEMSKDIASELLKPEDLTEKQKANINFEDLTCAICHSERCMVCETGFYGCGRFCPNCLKPIHLHCAIQWAEQQQSEQNGNYLVLRCPFCYYLLKIPLSIHRERKTGTDTDNVNIIEKVKFASEAGEIMTAVCGHPQCGIMFDDSEDVYVYKCDACDNYFHVDCLKKSFAREKVCPFCKASSRLKD